MNDKIVFGAAELETLVALTDVEQERGLMFRLVPAVMSFPYEKPAIRKFWMKNTVCPLDIVFCHAGKVVDVYYGQPLSLEHVGPNIMTDLVVELPYGSAEKLGIWCGQSVKLSYSMRTLAKRYELKLKTQE